MRGEQIHMSFADPPCIVSKENEKLGYFRSAANHNDINISNSKRVTLFFSKWHFTIGRLK